MRRTSRHGLATTRAAALLAAAYAFVSVATVVTHEAGHWLLDRAAGAAVRVVAPPFGAPHIEALRPIDVPLLGWPDAAGPLANVLVGVVAFVVLWRVRRPALLPLLLWAPVALVQEGVNVLVQLATRAPGTDAMRLSVVGVPAWLLAGVGTILLAAGVLALLSVRPVAALPHGISRRARTLVWWVGLSFYPVVGLAASPFVPGVSLARCLTLLAFAVVIAPIVAFAPTRAARPAGSGAILRARADGPSVSSILVAVAVAVLLHLAVLPLA